VDNESYRLSTPSDLTRKANISKGLSSNAKTWSNVLKVRLQKSKSLYRSLDPNELMNQKTLMSLSELSSTQTLKRKMKSLKTLKMNTKRSTDRLLR